MPRREYRIWCSAHIEACRRNGWPPHPIDAATTKREANRLLNQAVRECSTDGAEHYIEAHHPDGSGT